MLSAMEEYKSMSVGRNIAFVFSYVSQVQLDGRTIFPESRRGELASQDDRASRDPALTNANDSYSQKKGNNLSATIIFYLQNNPKKRGFEKDP